MNTKELQAELTRRGASVRIAQDGRLMVGPASAIEGLRPAIAANRDALLYLVALDDYAQALGAGDQARKVICGRRFERARALLTVEVWRGLPFPTDPMQAWLAGLDALDAAHTAGDQARGEAIATALDKLTAAWWGGPGPLVGSAGQGESAQAGSGDALIGVAIGELGAIVDGQADQAQEATPYGQAVGDLQKSQTVTETITTSELLAMRDAGQDVGKLEPFWG